MLKEITSSLHDDYSRKGFMIKPKHAAFFPSFDLAAS